MKNANRTLLLMGLLLTTLAGCSKKDETTPAPVPDVCQMGAIDRGNNNKHTYTYNARGRVAQMTREFDGDGSGKISRYVYTFSYDLTGLLNKSVWTLDGAPNGSETYAYTAGYITQVNGTDVDGNAITNKITYNATGQITEFTYDTGDPANFFRQYFVYNPDKILVKRGYDDGQGNVFFEAVTKPTGKVSASEQLLTNAGLPFDVLTGMSWAVNAGGQGTTTEVFFPDQTTGKLVSGGTTTTSSVKTNTRSYLIEETDLDNTTKTSTTQRFTITGCN